MSSKLKNAERLERKQQKVDAGLISEKYPDIASVIVFMNYYLKGSVHAIMQRTVNYVPESPAFFRMECMRHDCLDGGFDLQPVIKTMTKGRQKSGKGELLCKGNESPCHERIDYSITIEYNRASR